MRAGEYPIVKLIHDYGIDISRSTGELLCKCPLHNDRKPSCRINEAKNLWYCDPCGKGGDAVEFVMAVENVSKMDALNKLTDLVGGKPVEFQKAERTHEPKPTDDPPPTPVGGKKITKTYPYKDKLGNILYEVVRYEPKDFRQRRMVDGNWVYSMAGATRVLYNLPSIIRSNTVYVVEGEKDADSLIELGYCATCNVGGAKKWLDGYSEELTKKEVVIIPDNDDAGKAHAKVVLEAVANKAKWCRVVNLPRGVKDITDYIETFKDSGSAKQAVDNLINNSPKLYGGLEVPVYGIKDMEAEYMRQTSALTGKMLDIQRTVPSLQGFRPIIPGEMLVIQGGTSSGKSMLAQNIVMDHPELKTLIFSMELPAALMFERQVAMQRRMKAFEIERLYRDGGTVDTRGMENVFVCPVAGIDPEDISRIIGQSELIIGAKPDLVVIDYIQLMRGHGSRYEKTSNNAEALKVISKDNNVITLVLSQIKRDPEHPAVRLNDGKDSGAIENSAGMVMGIWKDVGDEAYRHVNVLKCTKGRVPAKAVMLLDGPSLTLTDVTDEIGGAYDE